jgi:hypothetical protein
MKSHPIENFKAALSRPLPKPVWRLPILTALLFLAAGCHRDDVKVYRIAKEQNQASQPAAPALPTDSPNPKLPQGHPDISTMPGATLAAPATAAPQLTWKTPAGWTELPPGEMRVASFKVAGAGGKQADVSVIPLPGMAGTDAANVNRWRGQVGLPVVTDDELQKAAEKVEAGGQPAQLYDIAGTNPGSGSAERILGVIQHRDGMAWFYKMTGDAGLVEQQKPAFAEFLKSLNFGAPAQTQTEMPAATGGDMGALLSAGAPAQTQSQLQPGHLKIDDTTMPANAPSSTAVPSVSHNGQPNWQVPAGWQEVSGGQFLVAKFNIAGDGGATAAVNVSSSPGDGGGQLANLNRWRGQLGLEPETKEIPPTRIGPPGADIPAAGILTVDYTGTESKTGKPARLVGSIVQQNGQTWFYKLMGDAKVVESQKAAFTQFVQGVKY